MFNLHSNNNQSTSIKDHKRRDSVILSMPNLFRATELLYKSPITLFSTFKVEERDSETGDEFLMKSLKNEKCVAMRVRWEFDKFKTLEHPNLPQILFSELTDNYSYIVFEKPKGEPILQSKLPFFEEKYCRQIIYQLATVLQYTHAYGIIHRDLRPNNIFLHKIHDSNGLQLKLTLMDFRCTKMMKADERLAIMEGGSGYLSSYVRCKLMQFPAPEILMDLKYNEMVDSWFCGIFIYLLITKGKHIPYAGITDQEIEKNILKNNQCFESDHWLNISADLEQLCLGLLVHNPKLRFTISHILWSEWIRRLPFNFHLQYILCHWIRKYGIKGVDQKLFYTLIDYAMYCLCLPLTTDDTNESLVAMSNSETTVLHQFKMYDNSNSNSPYLKSDCFISVCTNVWLRYGMNPIEFHFNIAFAKNDIYIGIISDDYRMPNDFHHHIGSDDESLSVSLRTGNVYRNMQKVACVARYDYSPVKKFMPYNSKFNVLEIKKKRTIAQLKHNIQQTVDDDGYGNRRRMKKLEYDFINDESLCAIRDVDVRMRIDCTSRTIALMVNKQVMHPIYFEFLGSVSPAVTLCHCLDQISLVKVMIDKSVQ